jgi:hypothetical protein
MTLKFSPHAALGIPLCIAIVVYTVLRACLIPVTVDEAATCMNSVPRPFLDVLTYRADPVPNNHILNTLGIQLSTALFGMNTWSVRVPALLGGLLYVIAAFFISKKISSNWRLQLFALVLLLANLYVVEFFALARGYGLAAGLMLGAIWQFWIYCENGKIWPLILAVKFAGLSVLANFSLLNFFAPFAGLIVLLLIVARIEKARPFFAIDERAARLSTLWMVMIGAIITAGLCYLPMKAILSTDQLVFWKGTTFWKGMVVSAIEGWTHRHTEGEDWIFFLRPTVVLVTVLSVGGWIFWIWRMTRRQFVPPAMHSFVSLLFFGALLTHLMQVWLLDAPYLDKRTSLFLYPLLALHVSVTVVGWWQVHKRSAGIFMIIASILIAGNWYRTTNLRCSHEWYFDEHTFKVLNAIKAIHQQEQRTTPFTLDLNGFMINSFIFHTKHSDWPDYTKIVAPIAWHGNDGPNDKSEFYLSTNGDELDKLKALNYEIAIDFDPRGSFKLWRKMNK